MVFLPFVFVVMAAAASGEPSRESIGELRSFGDGRVLGGVPPSR